MYKNDRWGHRSFEVYWPDDDIINICDTDSKDSNLATLNYVEESLKITQNQNDLACKRLGGSVCFNGVCAGLCATAISFFGMDLGIFCTQNLCFMGMLGAFSINAILKYDLVNACHWQNGEIDKELKEVNDTRKTIERFEGQCK